MITNVLEFLETSARMTPDSPALADESSGATYRELAEQAQQIGSYLAAQNIGTGRPIAVLIDKNIQSIICFMGIVYSGNFYVPIDPAMPQKRIDLILDTLDPMMILSSAEGRSIEGRNVVSYSTAVASDIDHERLHQIRSSALDTDPLYSIFTSGSTGTPKGVLICHRSIIDLVSQFADTFAFPQAPVFGNQAPLDFDVSSKDIYCSLMLGGCIQMIPKKLFSVPGQLIPYLNDRGVNVIIWAASAMRIVSDFNIMAVSVPHQLKLVMFSGEVLPIKSLNDWMNHLPEAQFVNLYGPTEITCNCTYYIVDRTFDNAEVLPIGVPFRNTEVFLWNDEEKRRCSVGEIGEILVRGTCLAHGYYNDPERTAAAFVQNPMHTHYPEPVYRTGDLGFYKEDGNLYFASRKDFQIKHMGHRIELGEIEAAVNALDFVDVGCCIYDDRKEKIYLCYQAPEACDKQIVRALASVLPKYMWPNKFKHYTQIPMNKNSKIDRTFLKSECCKEE